MNRRSFLVFAGAAPLVAAAPLLLSTPRPTLAAELPALPAAKGYLGTADGRIYRSLDGERTWELAANFGKQCAIRHVRDAGDHLEAAIESRGLVFTLLSKDGLIWRTPPRAGRRV